MATTVEPSVWNNHTVRQLERGSIRVFMEKYSHLLTGRVLDFGSGAEPYRDLVRGEYVPFDTYEHGIVPSRGKASLQVTGKFDSVMCNQVFQYLVEPAAQLREFGSWLKPNGHLVMTYPTNWDEVENNDFWRFTKAGMELWLKRSGFSIVAHEQRAVINLDGFKFPLGYGVVAKAIGPRCALTADETAQLFTRLLHERKPFFYVRFGDGALECIYKSGISRQTCDGEKYSPQLASELKRIWNALMTGSNTYVGDWLTASFGPDRRGEYPAEYADLIGDATPNWVHFEGLLLMRNSIALSDFYKTVARDPRPKVLMGPLCMTGAAKMLRCTHVVTPMTDNLLPFVSSLREQLASINFEILLYGAGMGGNIPAVDSWIQHPERTYINLGSALDPLFRGHTRTTQISNADARQLLRAILW
jgi:SAM-dependent methyltransferase